MDIYELLNKIVEQGKKDNIKEKLDTECNKKLFEICEKILLLETNGMIDDIEDLTEDDIESLNSIELDKVPLVLKAPISDVLWKQKRNYQAAKNAIKAYLDLFNVPISDNNKDEALNFIKRAISISKQINEKELQRECCNSVYDLLSKVYKSNKVPLSIQLLEILIDYKYDKVSEILRIIDELIKNNRNVYSNIQNIKKLMELKVKCFKNQKDFKEEQKAYLELANFLKEQAEYIISNNTGKKLLAVRYLKNAIKTFRNNGAVKKAEIVHKRLVEIEKTIPESMNTLSIDMDTKGLDIQIREDMNGMSFEECIMRVVQLTTFYTRDDIKQRVLENNQQYLGKSFFGQNTMNSSGQLVLTLPPLDLQKIEEDLNLLNMHIFQEMLSLQMIVGDCILKSALCYIREMYQFEEKDLDFLVVDNPIIPIGREKIIRNAIYMFLKGQFYESIHILAPQIENIFRDIARESDVLTVTLECDGTSKEKVLSSIFELLELNECCDNDILFMFKGLLNEKSGANIRNEVAHGLLDEYSASSGVGLYFGCAIIKFLYRAKKCQNIFIKSKKLKTDIKLDYTKK